MSGGSGGGLVEARKRLHRIQRYHVRARFLGSLDWVCPWCGHINKTRLMQRHWRMYCRGTSCGGTFVPFINLGAVPQGGRQTVPPDFIIPDVKGSTAIQEAFPMGDLVFWKQGRCVHGMVATGAKEAGKAGKTE